MSGGSVNGRPLREEPGSYSITGVPRGNPSRAFHPGVMRMGSSLIGRVAQPEEERIETEGERQLKALAKKQIDTDVTLQGQLKSKKQFTTGVFHKSLVREVRGELSLKDYEEIAEKDEQIERLKQCGLSEEEIGLKLASEVPEKKRRLGIDPLILEIKLKDIDEKIAKKQHELSKPDNFRGIKQLSRHEYDLERSLLAGSTDRKLLSALTRKLDVASGIKGEGSKRKSREKKKKDSKIETAQGSKSESPESLNKARKLIDKICLSCRGCYATTENVNICDECAKMCCSDAKEEGPKTLCGPVKALSDEDIRKERLSVEEIRSLPRFKEYSAGAKSKTLYLKNLASGVTEFDLISLFGRFQKQGGPKLVYRLMSGRMKGQAFVTFSDEETSEAALELVNGYMLMGKPIVIQYGKKDNATSKS